MQGVISETHQRNWAQTALVPGEFLATCTIKADSRGFIIWPLDILRIKMEDRVFQRCLFVLLSPQPTKVTREHSS